MNTDCVIFLFLMFYKKSNSIWESGESVGISVRHIANV
jgi:hypothetical protein